MRGYMFRNRWGALLFVAMTLAGVTTLVGTGKHDGALEQATDQIAAQRARADQLKAEAATAEPAKRVLFTPDEELIDETLGDDPTPIDEFAAANEDQQKPAEGDQVIIIPRGARPGEQAGPAVTLQQ